MKLVPVLLSLALLSACAEVRKATDDVARTGARAAVDEVLVTRFPNVDGRRVTPFTDCVINNASSGEITSLARAALVGVDRDTVSLVFEITQRPDAAACLLRAGLAPTS
jgi:hypothetical protein